MLGDVERARVDPHLCDERSVLFTHLVVQVFPPVVGVAYKDLGVQHGGVAELGAVPAAQQTPSQLALVHHGGHHEAGLLQGLPPELEALELGHHWRSTSPDREVDENKSGKCNGQTKERHKYDFGFCCGTQLFHQISSRAAVNVFNCVEFQNIKADDENNGLNL